MIYENYKIFGPYKRHDGRSHVVLVHSINGNRKTVSYPKFLTEQRINRYLFPNETIHHIDSNFNNNNENNIRIINRSEHSKNDVKRLKMKSFVCPECYIKFNILSSKKMHDIIYNRKRNKAGPFCSKSCAGKYGKRVQMGEDKLQVIKINPEYYK